MRNLADLLAKPGRVVLSGAPEGRDALALADLRADADLDILYIARDDSHLQLMVESLRVFAPKEAPLVFPAWDCLPYDRVSPRSDICAERLHCLSRLTRDEKNGRLLLTTVNAICQKVPPQALLARSHFETAVGDALDPAQLIGFLESNGYRRVGTVMEPGEYAVRGGIMDLFAPGVAEPIRLDLFGDTVDSIRSFDPLSQRTDAARDSLALVPVSEVFLGEAEISRFRTGYRELFGAVTGGDPLYEAISAGRRHPGMEHWLPLFHEGLETLFDYLPQAAVFLEHLAEEALAQRAEQIADYFEARLSAGERGSALAGERYNPVPPERLYVTPEAWTDRLAGRAVVAFSPFVSPAGENEDGIDFGARRARDFAPERRQEDTELFDAVRDHVAGALSDGRRVVLACTSPGSRDRLGHLLAEHGVETTTSVDIWQDIEALPPGTVALLVLALEHGFVTPTLEVLSEPDILGDRLGRPRRRRRAANFLSEASGLDVGDLVVHIDHGIGRFAGLETIAAAEAPHDCLLLVYAGDDKLYLPVENIEMLSRHGPGGSGDGVALDKLGGASWQGRKAKLKKRLRDMAEALIRVAAERITNAAPRLEVAQGLTEEFAARFPYTETEDQSRAIDESLAGLAEDKPSDRLVCGDVGFGKTEVALRAAFAAALSGKQVAVVVPTTLLCRQHFQTFNERFAGYPVRIGQLSRMVNAKDSALVREGLADGTVDIVIGTHSLLSNAMKFSDLGLLIIDEEQHFGVAQKEKLKALKADVHVLTLTATPIPRTLQLAMSGVRELSLIATPPVDRLAVRTFVLPFDPVVIREAILRERFRGGQCFYVCPRIEDLEGIAAALKELVPEVSVVMAHGRLAAGKMDEVMTAFYDAKYDVLLSTTIIESGLDMPRVNTLIVHRSDMFGLAQLYQLRGRVGRSKTRAYAYFTVPSERLLAGAAEKRLRVIQTLDTLGAGFSLASHDLDIRGAGNLLGEEQSGQIKEVGLELYQQLLEEAVQAAKRAESGIEGEAEEERWSPQITVGTAVLIPEEYVTDLGVRLSLYRRLSELESEEDWQAFAAELVDRFGPLPDEVENLLGVVRIKRLCRIAGIEKVDAGPKGAVIGFRDNSFAAPEKLIAYIGKNGRWLRVRPDHSLVANRQWVRESERLSGLSSLVGELAALCAEATDTVASAG
jgi:transcription-repair coupling factor (superfamily II helicase)